MRILSWPRFHYCNLLFVFILIAVTIPSQAQLPVIQSGESFKSPFAEVYEKVAPSVVKIEVEGVVQSRSRERNPLEFFFGPREFQQQEPRQYQGMGSGVIVDRDGYIITNNHVIESPDKDIVSKITVTLNNNEKYLAEVMGRDPDSDIAVIKLNLDGKSLPAKYVAELGDSDSLKPGDYAIAIGNPLGLESTITVGVISALGRSGLNPVGARLRYEDFIQTDAQINPGNSGGALADINGRVIGINEMYAARYTGIGFAVPINLARNVMDQLIATGKVKRGFVGIKDPGDGSSEITKEIQEAMGLPGTDGVLIHEVVSNSPAEKAGLEHGNVILTLDGEKVKNFNDFMLKIGQRQPNETVRLEIMHDGKKKTVNLKLADRSEYQDKIYAAAGTESWRGISVVDLDSQLAQKYNLGSVDRGVVVVTIDEGSPASDTSLKQGDIIIEINNRPGKPAFSIDNVKDFIKVKEELKDYKKTVLLYCISVTANGQNKRFIAVRSE
ncbi:trypsin-like peptidase domain-containing protein [Candidatus Latescibacterota bacterium]